MSLQVSGDGIHILDHFQGPCTLIGWAEKGTPLLSLEPSNVAHLRSTRCLGGDTYRIRSSVGRKNGQTWRGELSECPGCSGKACTELNQGSGDLGKSEEDRRPQKAFAPHVKVDVV